MPRITAVLKTCNCCKKQRLIEEFYRDPDYEDGRNPKCRECCTRPIRGLNLAPICNLCDRDLTPNRTVRIDGRLLCYPCWREFWENRPQE